MVLDEIHTRAVIEHPVLNLERRLRKATAGKQRDKDKFFEHGGVLSDVSPAPQGRAQAELTVATVSALRPLADHH